jgi:hypothetical protein
MMVMQEARLENSPTRRPNHKQQLDSFYHHSNP